MGQSKQGKIHDISRRSAENDRKFGCYSKQAVLLTDEDHFHFDCIHGFRHRTERSLLKLLKEFQRVRSETPPAKPILQNEPNFPSHPPFLPATTPAKSRHPMSASTRNGS